MWKHEIISDLQDDVRRLKGSEPVYVQTATALLKFLNESVGIHCGEFDSYHRIMDKLQGAEINFNDIMLPYSNILMTYQRIATDLTLEENQLRSSRRAVLIYAENKIPMYSRMAFSISYFDEYKKWAIDPCMSGYFRDSAQVVYIPNYEADRAEENHKLGHMEEVSTAIAVLHVLHCKNVNLQPVEPPEKLNKKRLKNGKVPKFRYHTLTVDLNKSQQRATTGGPTENVGMMPVHLCRGHFKEYTAEKPLLGKFVGRYWWQDHLRGDKKQGVVLKDYDLKYDGEGTAEPL